MRTINIQMVDHETNNVVSATMNEQQLKDLYDFNDIDGLQYTYRRLVKELERKNNGENVND